MWYLSKFNSFGHVNIISLQLNHLFSLINWCTVYQIRNNIIKIVLTLKICGPFVSWLEHQVSGATTRPSTPATGFMPPGRPDAENAETIGRRESVLHPSVGPHTFCDREDVIFVAAPWSWVTWQQGWVRTIRHAVCRCPPSPATTMTPADHGDCSGLA
jgi:hypothetical protein